MSTTARQEQFFRTAMLFPLIGGYVFVNFHRVSMAVMAPDLMSEFLFGATAIGFISSLFFYAYTASQIPIGLMADMVGTRQVVSLALAITALGALIFGSATNAPLIFIGRMIMGIGVAGIYPPAMKLFAQWYEGDSFSSITGLYIACGNLGAVLAAAPFAYVVGRWGWRQSHIFIGIITLGLALSAWLFIREGPGQIDQTRTGSGINWGQAWGSFKEAISNKAVLYVGFLLFLKYGPYMGVQGLWGIPFFMDVYNMDRVTAGSLLSFMPIGYMVGAPITGFFLARRIGTKKSLYFAAAILMILTWLPLTIPLPGVNIWLFRLAFLFLGIGSSAQGVLTFSLARDVADPRVAGTTMALVSAFPFAAATLFQPFMGAVLDLFGAGAVGFSGESYYLAFRLCFLALILLFFGVLRLPTGKGEEAHS
ncbi:MAG: MFS transporter [Limnochordia bacterium]|jgi:MFS family permease